MEYIVPHHDKIKMIYFDKINLLYRFFGYYGRKVNIKTTENNILLNDVHILCKREKNKVI